MRATIQRQVKARGRIGVVYATRTGEKKVADPHTYEIGWEQVNPTARRMVRSRVVEAGNHQRDDEWEVA